MHSVYSIGAYSKEVYIMTRNAIFCNMKSNQAGRFIEACLLCLLKEEKAYGYGLMERLSDFGFSHDSISSSVIYRNLRNMESDQLVVSSWEESEQGPDRRFYNITPKGEKELDNWIILLRDRHKRIESIISKYENIK